jgi:steroid delta-isomerase-like uncharacterized protein
MMANAELIVQTMLAALTRGDFVGVVEHFKDRFIFIDNAIELEFTDKAQLIDFLTLNRKLFPDSKRADKIICSSGDLVVTEWALTGTKREQYLGHMLQLPFHARGVSIVQVDDGKVTRWSEYYDQTLSRRLSLAASFIQID